MSEALILEFTGVGEARVRWVPLLAYHQPGA
jgi:hypothetical protein